MSMNVKDCIDKFKDLVDTIIIQFNDGGEREIPSEDAEFEDEEILEMSVATVTMNPHDDYCVIYTDD